MKLKQRNDHVVMYNKEESIEMLKNDNRVAKVRKDGSRFEIITRPIKLNPSNKKDKELIVCPIGQYKISVDGYDNIITDLNIHRLGGTVNPMPRDTQYQRTKFHTMHIADGWGTKICWGNAMKNYNILLKNNDWYWLSKLALDLISDGEPELGQNKLYLYTTLFLQYKYALERNNKKWQRQLRKIIYKKTRRVRLKKWL